MPGVTKKTWRDDGHLSCKSFYRKKFSLFPVKCSDGSSTWFSFYYKKYNRWSSYSHRNDYHDDFVENVSEEDYIVRKLAENL